MAGVTRPVTGKTKKNSPAKSAKRTAGKTARAAPPKAQKGRAPQAAKGTARKAAKSPARKAASPAKAVARARANPTTTTARSTARRAPTTPRSSPRPRAASRTQLTLEKLHQVALTATDLDASVAFYRDTLGMRFIARFDPPGLAFFNIGAGVRLMLSATASAATLYFMVDDLKSAFREFTKRGVHFLQPPALIHHDEAGDFGKKGNDEWMAFFRDPAGNMLALVEKR